MAKTGKTKTRKKKNSSKTTADEIFFVSEIQMKCKSTTNKTPLRRTEPRKFYATKNNHSFIDLPIRKKVKQHQVKTKRIPKMIPKMLHTKMVMKAKRR
jgi:hypothetical protein